MKKRRLAETVSEPLEGLTSMEALLVVGLGFLIMALIFTKYWSITWRRRGKKPGDALGA